MVGSGQARAALGLARFSCDALNVIYRYIKEMRSDRGIASGEHEPGTFDPLFDDVRVPGRVFLDGVVYDLGLRGIREGGEVADALLRLFAHFDRRLAGHETPTLQYLRILVPK